jgi:hypothetical protein
MLLRKLLRSRKGQSRILEAVVAAAIIFTVFAVSLYLVSVSNVKVLQERADLDRLGYNTLHRLVESGTIESTIERRLQADFVRTIIQKSLPSETYFNLTIFICSDQGSWVKLEPHPSYPPITNAPEEAFANLLEVSSTSMIYTSKKGNIYQLVLVLARAGGG